MSASSHFRPSRVRSWCARLRQDSRAFALTEFAIVAPTFVTLGMFGAEVAYMASIKMQISQISLGVADNAARLGQSDNSGVAPTVNESDVTAVLRGAVYQGESMGFNAHGRIILSSLEFSDAHAKQYIHWQRCAGSKNVASRFGNDGSNNGLGSTPITGMGSGSTPITASSGSAVMFVEVSYDYQKLFPLIPVGQNATFREEAALIIRDDRNLTPGLSGTNTSPCT
ncbi:TadE/TadG family type IV pilus assembly protein [Qipengyuania sp.]|uniref:TadE/TadG family type IV pilus assembly protein n=1 Tax=Qipengyuania sp. TaxID=2004515 RepID=UPI0035C7E9C3